MRASVLAGALGFTARFEGRVDGMYCDVLGLVTTGYGDLIEEALKIQKNIRETNKVYKVIGAILTEKGVIGPEDIGAVLQEQKRRDGFILRWWIYSVFHSMQPK